MYSGKKKEQMGTIYYNMKESLSFKTSFDCKNEILWYSFHFKLSVKFLYLIYNCSIETNAIFEIPVLVYLKRTENNPKIIC